jgi:hypothetical protein
MPGGFLNPPLETRPARQVQQARKCLTELMVEIK